ncbi:MAG: ABC transporter ATP-binding protein [Halobacteriota archaeon]
MERLLELKSVDTSFPTRRGEVKAVNNLDLELMRNERMALVGETGCGKSVLAQTILRLLPGNARVNGSINYRNKNILELDEEELNRIRGREIGLVPQSLLSINPLMKIGNQIGEAIQPSNGKKLSNKVGKLLEAVGLDKSLSEKYPHQLSGGMKRRVLISMGIACNPSLIIADEPTTGLDTIVKNRIMKLLENVTSEKSLLLITHDIDVARTCENIAVMYAGEIVERGSTREVLNDPHHPYTKALLDSLPSRGLKPIKGSSPSLINPPRGCKFHPRCPHATEECKIEHPELRENGRGVRCHAFS